MRQSELFLKTKKEAPKGEQSANAVFLQRGGFIHKEMAGVYSFLPLGLRVLRKVENIVREEMVKIGGQEMMASVLQPKEIWEKTGRWSGGVGKEVMYKCEQKDGEVGLGPTHEEMFTEIARQFIQSYEDLPLALFQIQTKFRRELRSRSGLLRGREFGMKDLYSFHADEGDFWEFYERAKQAYFRVFQRCGLEPILTEAAGGGFTKTVTHEFQVLAPSGEDEIVYCPNRDFAQNKEIAEKKEGDPCPHCGAPLKKGKAIEVGNIFPLGTKYSEDIGLYYQDREGRKRPVIMGSYGIGTTRLVGTLVEVFNDGKGIVWPKATAPFDVHILALWAGSGKDSGIRAAAEKLSAELEAGGFEVLYDDRGVSAGEKLVEADLIGIPWRAVVSEKTLEAGGVELKARAAQKVEIVGKGKLVESLKEKCSKKS